MFGEYLLSSFKDAIDKSYFPTALKQANITPVFKTGEKYSKDNYRPTGILSNVSKKLKNLCFVKYLIIWISFYPNTSAVSEKNTTRNIAF